MNLRKVFKLIGVFILVCFIGFFIYSMIPRVLHHTSPHGKALQRTTMLSEETTSQLKTFIRDTASRMSTVMVVYKQKVIFEEGDTEELVNCHSARKSIMSLLIGIARDKYMLDLNESLESLGIDERRTPLTTQEKSATIRDLLMARSGIYIPAEAEVAYAKSNRLSRDQYKPGERFFYNNFDFNVLAAILEKKTGQTVGDFLHENLAIPLGMQDYSPSNIVYNSPWPVPNQSNSDYPVYWVFMSARDFAKIGVLIAQNGQWNHRQVVSREWIEESLEMRSEFTLTDLQNNQPYEAFAYSWWIDKDYETVWADGYGGQFLCIDRARDLVVVQRNFTGNSLLSSGLFLLDKNRDNNPKSDLIHVYDVILQNIERGDNQSPNTL